MVSGVAGTGVPSKSPAESAGGGSYIVEFVLHVVDDWGYRDVVLHTDGEPSIVALVQKVKEKRSVGRTLLEQGPRYSHQSQGQAEQGCKALEGQTRTFLHHIAERTGLEFEPGHPIVSWAVRHSGFCVTALRVLSTGRTSYRILRGKPYGGELLCLGELAWARDPTPLMGQSKLDDRWTKMVWLGKVPQSDEHLLVPPGGGTLVKCRTVRRLPEADR